MTALSADANLVANDPGLKSYPVADNVLIYKGSLVCVNAAGYAIPADTTQGNIVVGVAYKKADNTITGHTAGGINILVESGRNYTFVASGMAQARVGAPAYVVDSATVGLGPQTNDILVGEIVEYISATSVKVHIPNAFVGPALRTVFGQATTATASDTIATGLEKLVGVVACFNDDLADDPEWVSASIGDQAGAPAAGSFLLKTWKNTGGTDPTPVAATTFTKKVNWVAFGY